MTALESRISQVTTKWTEIFAAHGLDSNSQHVSSAQQNVLKKYGKCVFRYLLGATRSADVAEELAQEFAFRFIRGDLSKADPSKGRFRDYLRVVLRNLVNDYFRNRTNALDISQVIQTHNNSPFEELESAFRLSWREEIMDSAWSSLKAEEQQKRNCFYTVLRFRAENPKMKSMDMAAEISERLGRTVTAEWVRQKLHRARQRYGHFILTEVRKTISPAEDLEQLHDELADLQLLELLQDSHPDLFCNNTAQ